MPLILLSIMNYPSSVFIPSIRNRNTNEYPSFPDTDRCNACSDELRVSRTGG